MFDLERFIVAQQKDYKRALNELQSGKKQTHWMWYIFPQIQGLGRSSISQYYAIQSLNEAKAFLNNPYLGNNLIEICETLISLDSDNATEIFSRLDDIKLKSSMTLFAYASNSSSVFESVLEKFFHGKPDYRTLKILEL
jgi:uncharacterized protein (DUF1810 family)